MFFTDPEPLGTQFEPVLNDRIHVFYVLELFSTVACVNDLVVTC